MFSRIIRKSTQYIIIYVVVILILFKLITVYYSSSSPSSKFSNYLPLEINNLNITIKTETCPLPKFNKPSDFFKSKPNKDEFKCEKVDILVYIEKGYIYTLKNSCKYQCLERLNDFESKLSDFKVLNNQTKIPCSFFVVTCNNLKQYVMAIYKDEELLQNTKKKSTNKQDILLFGIDSMSHRAWKYYLPKTYDLFHNQLGGVLFEKYNTIGDGTTANLQGILTGTKDTETYESRRRIVGSKPVDDYLWLWKEFKRNNYITGYIEDMQNFGTFQYRLQGFNKIPTDYYGRYGLLYAENNYVKKWCLNNEVYESYQLKLIEEFYETYKEYNTFMFGFFGYMSHDENRYINYLDEDLMNFFKKVRENNPNLVIILFSDHGHRFYSRLSMEGKYEERLPYLGVLLPENLKIQYQKQLVLNSKTLVTCLDAHATIQHILNGQPVPPQDPFTEKKPLRHLSLLTPLTNNRSCNDVDLLPHWCACLKWAEVYPKQTIKFNSLLVRSISEQVVKQISDFTEPYRQYCQVFQLRSIVSASLLLADPAILAFKASKDMDGFVPDLSDTMKQKKMWMRLLLENNPFKAQFEVTVEFLYNDNNIVINPINFREVSRLDRYAPYIKCVGNIQIVKQQNNHDSKEQLSDLRKFCICK